MASKCYAYALEDGQQGIVDSWKACEALVSGKKARYRSFKNREDAQRWLDQGAPYEKDPVELEKGIYFDAGTGRGQGVEVSVTDEAGRNLLPLIMDEQKLNAFGKYPLPGRTNNHGELFACFLALKIALQEHIQKIHGDSDLVLRYWSKGHIKESVDSETRKLAFAVKQLREAFEKQGGRLVKIRGEQNPADLGFHR
ncbi:MAG: ribonuclease HI [DPANN group archaeon]|nr:ribonuclease HI [DPANN group archaeon]